MQHASTDTPFPRCGLTVLRRRYPLTPETAATITAGRSRDGAQWWSLHVAHLDTHGPHSWSRTYTGVGARSLAMGALRRLQAVHAHRAAS